MSSTYTGPGSGLGEPRANGWTWNEGASELFGQRNSWDPTTGMLVGPDPLPPHPIAMQYQAEHDRRVWQYRQNLMRSALGYGQGALGLLQSYRAGGSSAIEAGQYNTLANIQLNRAQMTQPLDLMGDYRREQDHKARAAANRQAERQLAVQGAAAIASIAGAFFTGGATLAMMPGIINGMAGAAGGAGAQYPQGQQRTQPVQPSANGPDYGKPAGPQNNVGPQGPTQPMPGPQAPSGGGQVMQSTLQPGGMGGAPQGAPQPGGGAGGAQSPQGSGMGEQAGGPAGASGAAGSGLGMGPGAGGVGSDGNFSPVAWAARAAATEGYDPLHNLAMSRILASEIENDPVWASLSTGVDRRLADRIMAREVA